MSDLPAPEKNPYRNLSFLLLATTSLIWGTSFILIKKASVLFDPVEVGAQRIFYAFIAFIPIFWAQRRKIPNELWSWIFLAGLIGSLIPSLLFSWAGSKIDSSLSGMLNAITPLFTVLIGTLFFRQRFSRIRWVGLFIGLLGAICLALVKPGGSLEGSLYIAPVIFATVLYAFNVNLLKIKFGSLPPLAISAATIIAVGPFATVLLFGFTEFPSKMIETEGSLQAAGYVMVLGLFGTAFALVLFNKLIQISGPLTASSVTYIMPVVSVGWGIADGESFGFSQAAGLAAILAGVYLVNKKLRE